MKKAIRNIIFQHHKTDIISCDKCSKFLNSDSLKKLPSYIVYPNKNLSIQYSEDELKKCKKCGTYFAITRSKEKSNIIQIKPISSLEAHIILWESDDEIEKLLHEDPDKYQKPYNIHVKGRDKQWKKFQTQSKEIILHGMEILRSKLSEKSSKNKKKLLFTEIEIAKILNGCIMGQMHFLSENEILSLIDLLKDKRKKIINELYSGFNIGLYNLEKDKDKLKKIKAEISKLEIDSEIQEILYTLDDLIGPYIPWSNFFTLSISDLSGSVMSDDILKHHLGSLKGVEITNYIQEVYTEAIIDFEYKGYRFSANNAYVIWTFSVKGDCPKNILNEIREHCQSII